MAADGRHAAAAPPDLLAMGCRGAIAAEMGRDPRTMRIAPTPKDDVVLLSYRRPDDRSLWRVVCRLGAADGGGTVVEWATVRDDGSVGRWRDDRRHDNKIVVSQDGKVLVVTRTYPDGSTATERMPLASVSGVVTGRASPR